jgi:hypothetical protein
MSHNKIDHVEGHIESFAQGSIHLLSGGRLINIEAMEEYGSVRIKGPDDVMLSSGAANLVLQGGDKNGSSVHLLGGMEGSVTLHAGPPNISSILRVEPDHILLQAGPEQGGASLRLDAKSLTIKVGANEWTLDIKGLVEKIGPHKREFGAEGNDFSIGPTKVGYTLKGIEQEALTLKTEIKTTIEETSLMRNETVQGILAVKATMAKIN